MRKDSVRKTGSLFLLFAMWFSFVSLVPVKVSAQTTTDLKKDEKTDKKDKNKPFVALMTISDGSFSLPTSLENKIKAIYS